MHDLDKSGSANRCRELYRASLMDHLGVVHLSEFNFYSRVRIPTYIRLIKTCHLLFLVIFQFMDIAMRVELIVDIIISHNLEINVQHDELMMFKN